MIGKIFVWLLTTVLLTTVSFAEAQQAKVHRIGFLRTSAAPESYLEAFRQGLKGLGYIEGKNIAFEYRWAGGKIDRLPALAAELVSLKVDIIVTDGTPPALAARKASGTIPIVMASSGDPVGTGLIASLARPGGNITGLTSLNAELSAKVLELLKEIIPRLTQVANLGQADSPVDELAMKNMEAPARALGVKLIPFRFRGPDDYEGVFRAATKERAGALLVHGTPSTSPADRKRIVELAAKNRLPAVYDTKDWADNGGLMSYGADRIDMYRRAATYADKILKGAKPADLPVEQPTRFELVINMKTAKALGIKIPNSILVQTTKVIE